MDSVSVLGFVAATLTTLAFLPQTIHTVRSRSTRDISLLMFLALTLGIVLWLIYGLLRGDWPLVAANGATLAMAGTILAYKIRFK